MKSFVNPHFFKCGNISFNRDAVILRVTKFFDINEKIISFFQEHKIIRVKSGQKKVIFFLKPGSSLIYFFYKNKTQNKKIWGADFNDWCKVASLMKEKNI